MKVSHSFQRLTGSPFRRYFAVLASLTRPLRFLGGDSSAWLIHDIRAVIEQLSLMHVATRVTSTTCLPDSNEYHQKARGVSRSHAGQAHELERNLTPPRLIDVHPEVIHFSDYWYSLILASRYRLQLGVYYRHLDLSLRYFLDLGQCMSVAGGFRISVSLLRMPLRRICDWEFKWDNTISKHLVLCPYNIKMPRKLPSGHNPASVSGRRLRTYAVLDLQLRMPINYAIISYLWLISWSNINCNSPDITGTQ